MKSIKRPCAFISVMILLLMLYIPVSAAASNFLAIHSIDVQVNEDGNSYTVQVYLSVLDENDVPIEGLTAQDIEVSQDGNAVKLDSVEISEGLPLTAIIVMDVSGSMKGERLALARQAISDFVKSLYRGDQAAIFTFSSTVDEVVSLTDDLNAVRDQFDNAAIRAEGGTCLYDATFQAVQAASGLPQGRRVVVVLSDGKDTVTGSDVCSSKTIEDIVQLASQDDEYTPIYTIGIGSEIDQSSLQRIAEETGGVFAQGSQNSDLPVLFEQLASRLTSEHVLQYTTTTEPGEHKIAVTFGNQVVSRTVNFPSLPPVLSFASPTENQVVAPEKLAISLNVIERGMSFTRINFTINGAPIGGGIDADQIADGYEIDLSQYADQVITIGMIALDDNGNPLSSGKIKINVAAVGVDMTEAGSTDTTESEESVAVDEPCPDGILCLGEFSISTVNAVIIGAVFAALIVGIIVVSKLASKKKDHINTQKVSLFEDDATIDGFAVSSQELGRLTILESDDPMMVGKEYILMKSPSTIGRSISNEVALPKDSAVSRSHAEIVQIDGQILLREILKVASDGSKTAPTYGTYVNDRKISGDTVLKNGDIIALGRRTKLRYTGAKTIDKEETYHYPENNSDDVTFDGIQAPEPEVQDDATRDG